MVTQLKGNAYSSIHRLCRLRRLYKGINYICQSLQSPTSYVRNPIAEANDKPTKYGIHSSELHPSHSDHAHKLDGLGMLQQRQSLMQARSGLFADQSPALRIVHARSRYHLRRRRRHIRRLCLRCLSMWPGCPLPARPHRHPNHNRERQLRDGEHRALPSCYSRPRLRRPLRARTRL
jgi:hypothetical protein